jgi:hypothetical protein
VSIEIVQAVGINDRIRSNFPQWVNDSLRMLQRLAIAIQNTRISRKYVQVAYNRHRKIEVGLVAMSVLLDFERVVSAVSVRDCATGIKQIDAPGKSTRCRDDRGGIRTAVAGHR